MDEKKKKSSKSKSKKPDTKPVEEKVQDIEIETTDETEVSAREVSESADTSRKPEKGKKGTRRSGGGNNKALELENEKLKAQLEESEDRYKRLLAEFENARNRNEKESKRMYDVGAKEVLELLLPVVDNFERAIDAIPEEDKERAFEQGVDKIYKQMMVTLEDIGVKPMNAAGTEFDPNLHNAVMHVEDEEVGENTVTEELQKGYMYKEDVLRHAMVKVAN